MGLLDRLLGRADAGPRAGAGARLADADDELPRSGPRREVIQVVLRETMRKHSIPSDWFELRFLQAELPGKGSGLLLLVWVREVQDRLWGYIPTFQHSFFEELHRFEPRARGWAFTLAWQLEGSPEAAADRAASPAAWSPVLAPGGAPVQAAAVAAVAPAAAAPGLTPQPPAPAAGPGSAAAPEAGTHEEDQALRSDLEKLFAIRDAALLLPQPRPQAGGGVAGAVPSADELATEFSVTQGLSPPPNGFEPTRPGGIDEERLPPPRRP